DDTPDVIVRMRGAHDDAVPNANAIMVTNLVVLNLLTAKEAYRERAEAILRAFAADLAASALGHCGLLAGAFDLIAPQQVVIVAGGDAAGAQELERALFAVSLPGAVQQLVHAGELPTGGPLRGAIADKRVKDGRATAYACLGPQCSAPLTEAGSLLGV